MSLYLFLLVGQLRLAYYSVLLLLKRPFVATGERNEFEVPDECYDAIQSILNIVEVVQIKSMLSFSWSLTSKYKESGDKKRNMTKGETN